MTVSVNTPANLLSKHRLEALTDGIFAVAMTLLVIELKIPEAVHGKGQPELLDALAHLLPKFAAWIVSFYVLAVFWMSSNRAFHFVRVVDGKLIFLKILLLAFVSLMPFASMLVGEYPSAFVSQVMYSLTMLLLALVSILTTRYIFNHHELCHGPMPDPLYRAARFRTVGLMAVAVLAMVIAYFYPAFGSAAFASMFIIRKIGQRMERKQAITPASTSNEDKIQSV
jgi:uncharacterized membrane protein